MRALKYREPTKVYKTDVRQEYIDKPAPLCYQRCVSIITKYGIVLVDDMKWETNYGIEELSVFSTTRGGITYSATLEEGELSDMQIKWLSTNFIKKVISNPAKLENVDNSVYKYHWRGVARRIKSLYLRLTKNISLWKKHIHLNILPKH